MQTVTNMAQLVDAAMDRRRMLEPVDLVERLDRFQAAFPEDGGARLVALSGGSDRTLELTDHALGQILARLGIPAQYFNRCPSNLQWAQANHWIQNVPGDKNTMLRLVQGNRVRAALSESYTAFDDVDVVPMVADVLDGEDCRVHADFSAEYTHLRITFPKTATEVKVGDVVQAGVHISNSEVGCRAVHVDALVHRLVCTNGLVSSEYASRASIRHVGNPARLKDYVRQAIGDARDGSADLIRRFKASVDHVISEPERLLERHGKEHDLTQAQLKAALEAFAASGDHTLFGAVNAITRIAQSEPTFERRYQVERAGAALLARHT
jgi:hypothetical protein